MAAVISDSCDVFQSTPSARRATRSSARWTSRRCYFNPRPPRGGRPGRPGRRGGPRGISIHALREEGDGSRGAGR